MLKVIIRLIITLPVLWAISTAPVLRAEPASREYLVKAAFLYNFAKFIEWPTQAFLHEQAPIYLCILGQDPFGGALESVSDKLIKNRRFQISHINRIEDMPACHILFICRSEERRLAAILTGLKDRNVLTVGDMENFVQLGGVINFTTSENKIRFEINMDAADQSGLQISSKLLKLAKTITHDSEKTVN